MWRIMVLMSIVLVGVLRANPILVVFPVLRNGLDSAEMVEQGHDVWCDWVVNNFANSAGIVNDAVFDVSGFLNTAMKCTTQHQASASFDSGDFVYCPYSEDNITSGFPAPRSVVSFWLCITPEDEPWVDLTAYSIMSADSTEEYSFSINTLPARMQSGFVLRWGVGGCAASSTSEWLTLEDLFPGNGGVGWHHFVVAWNNRFFEYYLSVDGVRVPLELVSHCTHASESLDGPLELLTMGDGCSWAAMDEFVLWERSMAHYYPHPELLQANYCEYSAAANPEPASYKLSQNAPNPFNPGTSITFELEETGPVELAVYNLKGQHVTTLVDGLMELGEHQITFDATGLPSGVYYYRLVTQDGVQTKSMTLVK